MAFKKTQQESATIEIARLEKRLTEVYIVGETPLIINRMAEKAKHELLLPKGRKSAGDKATSLKHNPLEEFRASPYTLEDDAETLLAMVCTAFKGAIRMAALRVPGANATEIGQLVFVKGEYAPIFGIPQILLSVVRSADIKKTPDIRSRVIIKRWAAKLQIQYVHPNLTAATVINLLQAGGTVIGVGDWRPEKGKGNYGQFTTVNPTDPEYLKILKSGGRAAQIKAMENPEPYDKETAEMLSWFTGELTRRGRAA